MKIKPIYPLLAVFLIMQVTAISMMLPKAPAEPLKTPVTAISTQTVTYIPTVEKAVTPVVELVTEWYTQAEYELLCKLVMAEMGTDTVDDLLQQEVAMVVINRVNHEAFPDTIYEVIYQDGQYACVGYLDSIEPTEKVKANVLAALNGECDTPEDVVWQAGFEQAAWGCEVSVYKYYDTEPYDTYLCHYGEPEC